MKRLSEWIEQAIELVEKVSRLIIVITGLVLLCLTVRMILVAKIDRVDKSARPTVLAR